MAGARNSKTDMQLIQEICTLTLRLGADPKLAMKQLADPAAIKAAEDAEPADGQPADGQPTDDDTPEATKADGEPMECPECGAMLQCTPGYAVCPDCFTCLFCADGELIDAPDAPKDAERPKSIPFATMLSEDEAAAALTQDDPADEEADAEADDEPDAEAEPDAADEQATGKKGYAIKSLGNGRVGTYAVLFGSAKQHDISPQRDFFTKETDFWLDRWAHRPMIFEHGMVDMEPANQLLSAAKSAEERDEAKAFKAFLQDLRDDPVIGTWDTARIDPYGVWVEGVLDRARKHEAYVQQMIDRGGLRASSDSISHLVQRVKQPNGAHFVKRWPLIGISTTATPAEPRMLPVAAIKSYYQSAGIPLPPSIDATGADATGEATASREADVRRRRLSVELDLLALE